MMIRCIKIILLLQNTEAQMALVPDLELEELAEAEETATTTATTTSL